MYICHLLAPKPIQESRINKHIKNDIKDTTIILHIYQLKKSKHDHKEKEQQQT